MCARCEARARIVRLLNLKIYSPDNFKEDLTSVIQFVNIDRLYVGRSSVRRGGNLYGACTDFIQNLIAAFNVGIEAYNLPVVVHFGTDDALVHIFNVFSD